MHLLRWPTWAWLGLISCLLALTPLDNPTQAQTTAVNCPPPLLPLTQTCPHTNPRPLALQAFAGPEPAPAAAIVELGQTDYHKAAYLSHNGLASGSLLPAVQNLLETSELNAIVIDIKTNRGLITYPSQVDLAVEIGASHQPLKGQDWPQLMAWFKARNIYTIARLVTFQDEALATARPEWAVTNSATGAVWQDEAGLSWADPSHAEVWAYNIALAEEAAQLGFDEIQFAGVHFPSGGNISQAKFTIENTPEHRLAAISGFLAEAQATLAPYPIKLGATLLGYTAWRTDDMGIGQSIESLAPYVDVLSPLLYPSTFTQGLPGLTGYETAIAHPYEVVYQSTMRAVLRGEAVNPNLIVRPWLQDFPDEAFDGRTYTPSDIRAQMAAVREAGGRGWMLWNADTRFTEAALAGVFPLLQANLAGQMLVLEYHRIGEPEERWQRTPANFRADLERLLSLGFYPVNLKDMARGNLGMVPAGKRPIVLTFDDSTQGQFSILPDGRVDPESAIGIWLDFSQQHPADWPPHATFFVLQGHDGPNIATFGQPEYAQRKLELLVEWGFEVASHTITHAQLDTLSEAEIRYELGRSQQNLEAALPGYAVTSFSVPYGIYPWQDDWLVSGTYEGQPYQYEAIVEVSGGLNPSPFDPSFNRVHIYRVQAIQSELDIWLNRATQPGAYYVSAGE